MNNIPIFMPHMMPSRNNDDNSENTPSAWGLLYLFYFSIILFLIILLTEMIDYEVFGSKLKGNLYFDNQCDYIVPDKWHIVTDGNEYAVKNDNGEFLSLSLSYPIKVEFTYNQDRPLYLSSECKAKACLKYYLNPKINTFK